MPPAAPVPHPLPEPLIELVAQRFRVLGEPMRIKLLDRLRDGTPIAAQAGVVGADQLVQALDRLASPDAVAA